MKKTKYFSLLILLFAFQVMLPQSVEISGKVESNLSLENIHVINVIMISVNNATKMWPNIRWFIRIP